MAYHAPACIYDVLASFELRFHQRDQARARTRPVEQWPHRGQHLLEGNEGDVDDDGLKARAWQPLGREEARVHPLQRRDARIRAEPRVQLVVPVVDATRGRRASAQQAVGEASGGGAHVQHGGTLHVDREGAERGLELEPSPRDESIHLVCHEKFAVGGDGGGGLVDDGAAYAHVPSLHGDLRLRAGVAQPA
eukprot:CAMPEP_0195603922 /NCGR_PEP_ID=MMETSP0815-20121206/6376_1 /TAXON_ID=97485 /ORGANISM="Prymnesium parvum, Strain Texoma1" /LENGTH=191 /DNA_ID=CAMNT_0040743561 /DNA_START=1382 /DNA_END=1953 /DNA_ORIENTATION=+